MIFLYYLVMLLITLAAVVGSTLAFDKEIRKFREPLFESMNHYNKSSKDLLDVKITEQWDKVQTQVGAPLVLQQLERLFLQTLRAPDNHELFSSELETLRLETSVNHINHGLHNCKSFSANLCGLFPRSCTVLV